MEPKAQMTSLVVRLSFGTPFGPSPLKSGFDRCNSLSSRWLELGFAPGFDAFDE